MADAAVNPSDSQTAASNSAQTTTKENNTDPSELQHTAARQEPATSSQPVETFKDAPQDPGASSTSSPQITTDIDPSKGKDKADSQPPPREGADDSLSIGPSPEESSSVAAPSINNNTTCTITLLLPTGARHPYKIDEKYLSKRGVEIPEPNDPFSISVYKLKELILREWREEWDGKPASPSSIRLIHFGKLLDDKEMLKKYHLSKDTPNVVHMSVRPAEMMEEDEGAKGKASSRESRSGRSGREGGGSGCCVIL
ncbi:ubiquitin-related domain-containing protein [Podospora fimiseda]|uniref:Ubiquitin-related domain-containing protein n=1 Tax=Podospora fimiseda TaxID=252190 RepID=A0AAN7H569_9PEZI|nr:ubiquitin-related domain-containing protein [Podospora fimiseda]